MPNAAAANLEADARALHTHNLGTANFTTVPHHIGGIGPRLFLIFDERGSRYNLNLHPRCARRAAMCLNAAACDAELLEQRSLDGKPVANIAVPHTCQIGNVTFNAVAQFTPSVGPQVILMIDETNSHYKLPIVAAKARLLAACLTTTACEADALERKARERVERREKAHA